MPLNPGIAESRVDRRDIDVDDDMLPGEDLVPVSPGMATAALIGRLLLAAIFLMSGIAKLTDTSGTAAHMTAMGIPNAETLAVIAGIGEIAGGASLVLGLLTRLGAAGLFLYMIPTTWIFHAFWNVQGDARLPQLVNFMKNLGIMGGLATLVAFGATRFSLDYRIRRARAR